ncbi:PH domain-containing protein [Candidatus Marsarchaeota archaeon]|jgi:hypothetical protein|nr:PH domain-containing protein [Candidatus Marsarchaeota archaeon]
MGVDADEVNAVKNLLWPDERVILTAKQRRIGPGGSVTVPTSVLATDKRIIIVNKANLGIRKDYESIPYKQITSVRLEKGMISSTVFVRVQGYDKDKGLLKNGKEEGEIDGLHGKDAKALADYLNSVLDVETQSIEPNAPASASSDQIFCSKCGARNSAGSAYCSKCGNKMA